MPRFALTRHDSPRGLHWDLFLEYGDVLRTWALREPPQDGEAVACDALGDHRLAYLDYEGPIAEDRGSVLRWDSGIFNTESQSDGELVVRFEGHWLNGQATLSRQSEATWQFLFRAAQKVS